MKRLIGFTAALCLLALTVGCGGVTSTGTLAYISNSTGTGFTVFTVNTDGTLTKSSISPQNTPASPKVLQFTANGKWAYFLDEGGTGVWGYTRSGNGELSTPVDPKLPYPLSGQGSALVISPNNTFLYVALKDTKRLVTYSIDASTGQLTTVGSPALINYSITQLVMAPGGTVLYGLAPDQQAVLSFTLNTSSGVATLSSTLPVGTQPSYIVLSANGNYMYVLDHTATGTNNNIGIASPSIFGYNTAGSGVLQEMAGSPFNENPAHTSDDPITGAKIYTSPSNPIAGATTSDTRYLLVANQGSHNISSFKINATSGELSEVIGPDQDVNGVITSSASPFDCGTGCTTPSFVAVAGSNNAFYLLDTAANKIFQFRLDQNTGRVRAQSPASVSAEGNPTWMTIR